MGVDAGAVRVTALANDVSEPCEVTFIVGTPLDKRTNACRRGRRSTRWPAAAHGAHE